MGDWRVGVLNGIGAPVNGTTLLALRLWAQSEGMPPSYNNWLATTLNLNAESTINSDGVRTYATESAGIRATVATLKGSNYVDVVRAFRAGNSLRRMWSSINASPWCAHCQDGTYPVALHTALRGGGAPSPPPPKVRRRHRLRHRFACLWHRVSRHFKHRAAR